MATCLLGYTYIVTKSVVLVAWHTPGADLGFWARFDQTSEPVIVSAACVLGALGAGWQSVVASGQAVRKRALLWQLQPLWSVLHQLAPGVELVYGKADVDFRLRRRVLEIEDALLEVEDRLAADVVQAAHAGAEAVEAPAALAVAAVLRYLADKGGWSSVTPGHRGRPTAEQLGHHLRRGTGLAEGGEQVLPRPQGEELERPIGRQLGLTEAHAIYRQMALYDMAFEVQFGLELSFVRTFAVPSIARVLAGTGEIAARPLKRSLDTALLMYEIIDSGPEALEGVPSSGW